MNLEIQALTEKVNVLQQKLNDNLGVSSKESCIQKQICQDGQKIKGNKNSRKKKHLWVGEIVFYVVLIFVILGALLIRSNSDGRPTSFAGFSMFTVLTSSMESEIPKGSLVITKNVSAEDLKIGDDITYMANETTTITHRIITIVEKYQDTGKRAFETKGIMNSKPDKNLVPASNVVGKVVFHNKFIGDMASFIGKHWIFIIFVLVVVFVIGGVLKKILVQEDKTKDNAIKSKKRD